MDGDAAEGATNIALVARRNNSLSWGGRLLNTGFPCGSCSADFPWIRIKWRMTGLPFRRTGTAGGGSGIPTTDEHRAPPAGTPENPLIQGTLLGEV
jgi:hypothetical protein